MRVIAGAAKGRRLASVPGSGTRPITDRVKESLFGILQPRIEGARFLDLFAGTGAVGIEALSRGAASAWFVERDWQAIRVIRHNLEATGLAARARVVRDDAFRFLKTADAEFDITHVAPPQYRGMWASALEETDRAKVLAVGGLAVVQIHPKEYREIPLQNLLLVDQRTYGSTMLCFYERADESGSVPLEAAGTVAPV